MTYSEREAIRSKLGDLYTEVENLRSVAPNPRTQRALERRTRDMDREIRELESQLDEDRFDWETLEEIQADVMSCSMMGLLRSTEYEDFQAHLSSAEIEYEARSEDDFYSHRVKINGEWSAWVRVSQPIIFKRHIIHAVNAMPGESTPPEVFVQVDYQGDVIVRRGK